LEKGRLKKWVFRRFLKTASDGDSMTFCGRVFFQNRQKSDCTTPTINPSEKIQVEQNFLYDANVCTRSKREADTKH